MYNPYEYFTKIEQPVSTIFYQMSNRGVRVDLDYLQKLKEELEEQKRPIEQEIINELGSVNLNSPKQLLEALHAKGIKPTLKGKDSTDKRALDALRHLPEVQLLLQYSEVETLLSSFVRP